MIDQSRHHVCDILSFMNCCLKSVIHAFPVTEIKKRFNTGVLSSAMFTIELDLNRGVSPFGPIRRQDTKIGGCHLAFSPLLLYRGEGWTASQVENVTTSGFSPRLKMPPIIWVNRPTGTPPFNPALWCLPLLWIWSMVNSFWFSVAMNSMKVNSFYSKATANNVSKTSCFNQPSKICVRRICNSFRNTCHRQNTCLWLHDIKIWLQHHWFKCSKLGVSGLWASPSLEHLNYNSI